MAIAKVRAPFKPRGSGDIFEAEPLSPTQSARLQLLEDVIDKGSGAFVRVGNSLAEIRDSKLYREHHKNFDQYCRVRWGFARSHAYRLIDASTLAPVLSPKGGQSGKINERICREYIPFVAQPEIAATTFHAVNDKKAKATGDEHRKAVKAVTALGPKPTDAKIKAAVDKALAAKRETTPDPNDAEDRRIVRDVLRALLVLREAPPVAEFLDYLGEDDLRIANERIAEAKQWVGTLYAQIAPGNVLRMR